MNPPVQQAICELEEAFPGHRIECEPDGDGGAFVRTHDLLFGDAYEPDRGWVVFRILYNYPHVDIYPHYLPPGLARRDGRPLGEAFHQQSVEAGSFQGPATMVSRKSNRWNPSLDNAALKLAKVLDWIQTRP